jgi:hypothetical protein
MDPAPKMVDDIHQIATRWRWPATPETNSAPSAVMIATALPLRHLMGYIVHGAMASWQRKERQLTRPFFLHRFSKPGPDKPELAGAGLAHRWGHKQLASGYAAHPRSTPL